MGGKELIKNGKKFVKEYPNELLKEAEKIVRRKIFKNILRFFLISLFLSFQILQSFYKDLPDPEMLKSYVPKQTSFIYGVNGDDTKKELLDGFYEENRKMISYNDIPENLKKAILAAEDKNFLSQPFYYWGFDGGAICRAIVENLSVREKKVGASTLYQQVVGMYWGSFDPRFDRKKVS